MGRFVCILCDDFNGFEAEKMICSVCKQEKKHLKENPTLYTCGCSEIFSVVEK